MASSTNVDKSYSVGRRRYEVVLGALGALGGGGLGFAAAGAPGLGLGAVIGAVAGGLSAWAVQAQQKEEAQRDSQLDIDIGVHDGDIGVPGLEHPPAKVGALSKEASGAGSSVTGTPASGPFLRPPDD